ncbi:MAG: helix-turn-helix domain-containing protein [Chloroflexota bacterium]|nr:helix-turn-helix domain-containing protein [Chloroflexota bacterium]
MSYVCISRVLAHSRQTGSAKLLLIALADFAHDDGTGATPSIATLARLTGTGERNVQLLIRRLEQTGELCCEIGAGPEGCNRYTICVSAADDPPITVVNQRSPALITDSSTEDESEITRLRKEGMNEEGRDAPTVDGKQDLPPPPAGEPALPADPITLWQSARGELRRFDLHQLQAFANEHDLPTDGYGRYWLGRAILAAAAYDPDFVTNPRALNLVRAILTRWRNHAAYGSDTPTYHSTKEEHSHESLSSTRRPDPVPVTGGRDRAACTIVGLAAHRRE